MTASLVLFVLFFALALILGLVCFSPPCLTSGKLSSVSGSARQFLPHAVGSARQVVPSNPAAVLQLNGATKCYGFYITPTAADELRAYPNAYVLNVSANLAGLTISSVDVQEFINGSSLSTIYNFQLPGSFLEGFTRGFYTPSKRINLPVIWNYDGKTYPTLQINSDYTKFNTPLDNTLCTTPPISTIADPSGGFQVWIYGSNQASPSTLSCAMIYTPTIPNQTPSPYADRPILTTEQLALRVINLDTTSPNNLSTIDLYLQYSPNQQPTEIVSGVSFGTCTPYVIVDRTQFYSKQTTIIIDYKLNTLTPSVQLVNMPAESFVSKECFVVCLNCNNPNCVYAEGTYLFTLVLSPNPKQLPVSAANAFQNLFLFPSYATAT